MAPGIRQMTSNILALDGRSGGANQSCAASSDPLRPRERLFLRADCSTVARFVFDPADGAAAIPFDLPGESLAAAVSPGKMVCTARLSETGSVNARIPERKPAARPTTKRNR